MAYPIANPPSTTAVIITTYQNPVALRRTLLGYLAQTESRFEIIIADDGSDDSLPEVWRRPPLSRLSIRHIWQANSGFGAARIRNRALASIDHDYVILSDADCIPRNDFVASHLRFRRPGTFLSGHRLELPESIQATLQDEDILSNRVFDVEFLSRLDPELRRYAWRLSRSATARSIRDLLGWRFRVFCSSNASAWRNDILRVNGFDEGLSGYGSEDRDLGARLHNAGVRSRYFKCGLPLFHQSHRRSYVDPAEQLANRRVFKRRLWNGETWVAKGIDTVLSR